MKLAPARHPPPACRARSRPSSAACGEPVACCNSSLRLPTPRSFSSLLTILLTLHSILLTPKAMHHPTFALNGAFWCIMAAGHRDPVRHAKPPIAFGGGFGYNFGHVREVENRHSRCCI